MYSECHSLNRWKSDFRHIMEINGFPGGIYLLRMAIDSAQDDILTLWLIVWRGQLFPVKLLENNGE